MNKRLLFLGAMLTILAAPASAQNAAALLPKVVLIGDSIRLGYAPVATENMKGTAEVFSPTENGADSANVLKNLDTWVVQQKPAVVHLNCGLHDLKLDKRTKTHQVELPQYEANLREIVRRVRETGANLVFANTTPILDDRHARRNAPFDRTEADVRSYNAVAERVMRELKVPVNDLHAIIEREGAAKLLLPDGTHYTAEGYRVLADAATDAVLRQLTLRRPRAEAAAVSGPEVAAAYRKNEATRDAHVPQRLKSLPVGKFQPPKDAATWASQRPDVYRKVVASLGDLPPRPFPGTARLVSRELRPGYVLERVAVDNGADNVLSALVLVPDNPAAGKRPAVMWLHSSTPDKNQILQPNTFWGEEPLGEVLVRAGYVVLSPDAYWHGDRAGTGPAGRLETGRDEQESLHKLDLLLGRTLWGMFVRDDQIALDYLSSRPEVDVSRIGATGMSMGSTRAWWLAAVDERVKATVAIACLTRYQNLIAHGGLRQHGVYYFVNGLMKHFDTEGVLALIAPRPFLALTGDLDAGSPADGVRELDRQVAPVYSALGAGERFRSVLYPEVGHTVTPEMRKEMLDWFERWLRPQSQGSGG